MGANINVTVTATDPSGNMTQCIAIVTVTDYALVIPVISGPAGVCSDGTWSIPTQPSGTNYQWKFDGIPINDPSAITAALSYTPPADGTLTVEISNQCDMQSAAMAIVMTDPAQCALLNCAAEQLYLDGEFLNHDVIPTDVRAISSISSNGTIDATESFKFYAGDSITLLPQFNVAMGGLFEAHIEPCQLAASIIDTWTEEEKNGSPEEMKARFLKALNKL